jgi:hypothetical protein
MRDVSIAARSHVPSRFERALEAAPVTHPEEGGGPDPQRSRAHSLSERGRPPGRFTFQFGGERAQSKPMPLPAPSVFKTAAGTFPLRSPWPSPADSNRRPLASDASALPTELGEDRYVTSSLSQ